ncbi:MAG: hypothetical protein IPM79_01555 [Polyangiaceae bacterium]|nr:hypothetical protein [Polyangiaceae bacterium]
MRAPRSAPILPVALIFSLAALSSACGDSGTGGSGGSGGGSGGTNEGGAGGAPTSGGGGAGGASEPGGLEADYCAPLAELVCARAGDCGCEAILPSGDFDEALCVAGYTERCLEAYAPLADAVTLGLASIDAGRAAECIDLLTTLTPGCERPRGTVTFGLCPAWFSSDVALGEPCTFPLCAEGAGFCDDGTCAPRPVAGESCQGLECVPGALCIDGECALPSASGAACLVDDECGPPLRCVSGECAALLDEGGAR